MANQILFDEFQKLFSRIENLEAENRSLADRVQKLEHEAAARSATREPQWMPLKLRKRTPTEPRKLSKSPDHALLHPVNHQTANQMDNQVDEQVENHLNNPPEDKAGDQAEKMVDDQAGDQMDDQADNQAINPADNQAGDQADDHMVEKMADQQKGPEYLPANRYVRFVVLLDLNKLGLLRLLPTFAPTKQEIPLFKHVICDGKGKAKVTNEYFVLMSDPSDCHLGADYRMPTWGLSREKQAFPRMTEKQAFEGTMLELKPEGPRPSHRKQSLNRSESRRVEITMPKYVFELGEMIIRSHDHEDKTEEWRSIYCHVVIDVTSNKKPMWLVYRYKGVEGGQVIARKRRFDRDDDMFNFIDSVPDFDVAQIAKDVKDWAHDDGTFGDIRNAEGLIKSTRCRANATSVRPVYEEFQDVVK
ncbi:hypothetical protein BJ170DRAFT_595245 [Xylariales sp. AK1849]|nr:hypothetical protein BJ170DRAFT_595245 [Xylariales sp. AK1849]